MPKGDRELLKADIEDGYGMVANLLIEALAHSKLNGVQKGICLFIIRRTYCWGQKEDEISLRDFAQACNTSQPYISRQIKQLIKTNIILRSNYQPGKTPTYTINTRVAQWDKGCIDVQGLYKCIRQGLYKCAIQGLHDCARVNQAETVEPVETEPLLKKVLKKDKESNGGSIDSTVGKKEGFTKKETTADNPLKIIADTLNKAGIIMPSPFEVESLLAWHEEGMELEVIVHAIQKAALAGQRKVSYINGILKGWTRQGITTLTQVEAADIEFERNKAKGNAPRAPDTSPRTPENDDCQKYLTMFNDEGG